MPVYDIAGVVDTENDGRGLPFIGGHPLIDERPREPDRILSEGAFSNRDSVGCEHRVRARSGGRPASELEAGSSAQSVEIVAHLHIRRQSPRCGRGPCPPACA